MYNTCESGIIVKGKLDLICGNSKIEEYHLNRMIEFIKTEIKNSLNLMINFPSPLTGEYLYYKSVLNWCINFKHDIKIINDLNDDYITQCNLILDELWMNLTSDEKCYVTLHG